MSAELRPNWEKENPLALERQVCFAMVVASRNVVNIYKPLLDPLGLTHPQYLVMLALWDNQPQSVKALSHQLSLDPGTLSPLLKRLETAGFVQRLRSSNDERQLNVMLTDKGSSLREQAKPIPAEVISLLGMSISELSNLHSVLTKVIAATQYSKANSLAENTE
ncbi:MAG: MarR family winged helix-turn-helix transcriptional regulator [Mycobacteriaceae bacterium]